mmetsp:Transcript_13335/g.19620  ORF Transcript_13335/g.19620 Transcript_13335/m.19620 type:complete len:684 (-) Transcript_13335:2394-4445(-)
MKRSLFLSNHGTNKCFPYHVFFSDSRMRLPLFFLLTLNAKLSIIHSATTSSDFPLVYTAIIPGPGSEVQTDSTDVYFAAEVDFLSTIETGLPSPYDGSGDDFVKISFMVHDEAEAQRLSKLVNISPRSNNEAHNPSHPTSMEIDSSLTQDLRDQIINHSADHGTSRLEYTTIDGYDCYKNLEGTFDWIDDMVERSNSIPNLIVSKEIIGNSFLKEQGNNGYDMIAMKVTGDGVAAAGRTTEKGVLFLMTGIHARELAPPELVSRWIQDMIDGYGADAEKTAILDHTEIYAVLQSNPDGRNVLESDFSSFRRKNLNPSGGSCTPDARGVDLNRNFPFRWGLNSGSSSDKCSSTYRGQSPGSEPEVKAIVDFCQSIFPTDQRKPDPEQQTQQSYGEDAKGIFFDVHSYGEIMIYPWGHQELETGDDASFKALANKFKHFNGYGFSGPNNGFSYPASGATDDWAYGTLGALGMTFELGNAFYQSCDYFEDNVISDNFPALTYAAKSSRAPYRIPKGPDITSTSVSVDGLSLTIGATASDSAFAAVNNPTSQQSVIEIRAFVDIHPYDKQNGQLPTGVKLSGQSVIVDISTLDDGKHTVYIQATDGDGYIGPVTATYFEKEESGSNTAPSCADSTTETFRVDIIDIDHDCSWLSNNVGNEGRFNFLCELLDIAVTCPYTCNKCAVFS